MRTRVETRYSSPASKAVLAIVVSIQMSVGACSTPDRLPAVPHAYTMQAQTGLGQVRFLVARDHSGFGRDYLASLEREKAYLASIGHAGPLPPAALLAISGGGDNGAYGAGLLVGWTASGTRPNFKVVTGISTGALIAPFAFLGPQYDPVLEQVYTTSSQRDIFKKRNIVSGLFGNALADTSPLYALISRHVDQGLLDAIAAEHEKGRVLLIGTTNFDALEPVVWNMTAIAASKDPRAPELFRKILLASASIPGAFPPVMLDVEVDGTRYSEMHVDGGTITQVFAYPPTFHITDRSAATNSDRKRSLYIIRNARLDPEWADVEPRTLPIAARAIASLTQTQGVGDLYRIYATAQRDGIDFNLAFIPATFDTKHREEFDTNYMQQLFATGRQMATGGYKWEKTPPGYDHGVALSK